jgi:GNAT superfamily N-acetyltransferase
VLKAIAGERSLACLGILDGLAVSAALAFIDREGVGGVYFVATETAVRGRGIGAALVGALLDGLEGRGVRSAILHATDLGRPVYLRLGFEDACILRRYFLPESRLRP